jgi:cellulose synthase operon protein C
MADQILGAALSGRGRYDDSIKILEDAYAAAPGAVQPMAALVNTLIRAQKMDRAIAFLQTVLVSNPANTEAHVLLGSVQLLRNEPDLALQTFQRAIEQQPKNLASHQALVDFYLRQRNNTDEALKVARAALQQVPEHVGMRLTLAHVLQEKGDYEAAIAEYEHLLKQQPTSLVVANNLASLLSDHRTDKASLDQAYALAASLRKSGMPAFKDTLGWVYYQRGEYRNAVALLEEAAAASPNLPLVRYHLGMSYVATNQLAKASEQFKKALELAQDDDLKNKILFAQEKAAI